MQLTKKEGFFYDIEEISRLWDLGKEREIKRKPNLKNKKQ
jgi:hypothetical protein